MWARLNTHASYLFVGVYTDMIRFFILQIFQLCYIKIIGVLLRNLTFATQVDFDEFRDNLSIIIRHFHQ